MAPLVVVSAVRMQANNPLHGITLATIVEELVAHYGFPALAERIDIRCFTNDPTVISSLKFLRRTPWAREKVEALYTSLLYERESGEADKDDKRGTR